MLKGDSADLSGAALDQISSDLQAAMASAVASSIGTLIMDLGQTIVAGEGSLDERLQLPVLGVLIKLLRTGQVRVEGDERLAVDVLRA